MTTSFTFISVIALFCYAFLFMTMVAAQKSRMINAFLLVLTAMIFWTGGSACTAAGTSSIESIVPVVSNPSDDQFHFISYHKKFFQKMQLISAYMVEFC